MQVFNEFKNVLQQMKDHIHRQTYGQELILHTLSNFGHIQHDLEAAISEYQKSEYNTSGTIVGQVLKFTFFWDFQAKNSTI